MEELITVVVPVYNVEDYLERCFNSIVLQSYRNLEIIIVDDGSTDNSGDICDKLGATDSRVTVIHKKNGGLSDARNAGIDIAKGVYISFVDSDDYIDYRMIENLHKSLVRNDSDISTCAFMPFCGSNGSSIEVGYEFTEKTFNREGALEEMMYQKSISNSAWGKLYKLSLFGNDIRYPIGKICEDLGTTYKLFARSINITAISYVGYFYLQRAGSILHSSFSEKRLDSLSFSFEQLKYINENYPKISSAAINRYFSEASFLLSEMSIVDNGVLSRFSTACLTVINRYKLTVLRDRRSRVRFRIFAFIAIPNARLLLWTFSVKRRALRLTEEIDK